MCSRIFDKSLTGAVGRMVCLILICSTSSAFAGGEICTWNGTNGTWDDGSRWSCSHEPGATDTAEIGAGIVTMNSPATVDTLKLSGGRFLGSGDLEVTFALNWTGGSMEPAGKTIVPQGATLTISGSNTKTWNRNMDLAGAATWSGSGGINFNATTITISTTGSFDFQTDQVAGGSSTIIANSGAVTKSAGAGVTDWRGVFNQTATGSLVVLDGTFRFGAPNSIDGTVTANGTTIAVGVFTTTFEASATFTATNLNVPGGNAVFKLGGASFMVTNATANGGNLTFDGPTVSLPNLTGSGTGRLSGAGDVEVTSDLTWSGSFMQGTGKTTVKDGATLSISGDTARTISRDLENGGVATWSGLGNIAGSSTFTNLSTGTLTIQNDQSWGTNSFVNNGAIIKSGGTGETQITPLTTQGSTGSFDVQTGSLRFAQGGSFDGSMTANGTTIQISAAIATFMATASLSATNFLNSGSAVTVFEMGGANLAMTNTTLTGGSIFFNGPPISLPNLTLEGGTVNGTGQVEVTGLLTWTGGTMGGLGKTIIPDGATLTISGDSIKTLSRDFDNAGSATWSGAVDMQGGTGTFKNFSTGSFEIQNAQKFGNASSTFDNDGSVVKTSGGETEIGGNFQQSSNGIFEVQDGSIKFSGGGSIGGTLDATGKPLSFTSGAFTFDPAVSFPVTDIDVSGVVDMSPIPNLTIDNLTQTAGGLTLDNPSVLILGDFVHTGGAFQAGKGRIIFGGDTTQNLTAEVATNFFLLEVTPNTLLIETDEDDNVTVSGFLRNRGTIQKTQAIPVNGNVTFGLTDIELDIVDPATFTFLEVNRVGMDHPNHAPLAMPGQYWQMIPIGGGFTVDLTLNHCIQPDAEMLLCRFTGAAWDCAQDLSTSTSITRVGVTQLDEWAMGAVDPNIFMTGFTCGNVSAWTDVRGLC